MSCSTFEAIKDLLLGSSKHIMNAMDLVKLVTSWKEWYFSDELEEDTTEAPDVHLLVVVTICH